LQRSGKSSARSAAARLDPEQLAPWGVRSKDAAAAAALRLAAPPARQRRPPRLLSAAMLVVGEGVGAAPLAANAAPCGFVAVPTLTRGVLRVQGARSACAAPARRTRAAWARA
jgi:hypothetical protein